MAARPLRFEEKAAPIVGAIILLAFVAFHALCAFKLVWRGDFPVYLAGVRELLAHPLSPTHESLGLPAELSYAFTPYLYLVAFVGAVTGAFGGADPYRALQIAGVLNLVLFTTGCVSLFKKQIYDLSRQPVFAAAMFVIVMLAVREKTFFYSSETSLDTFAFILAYPSLFAWGAVVWCLSCVESWLERGNRLPLLFVFIFVWLALTSHPLTGSWLFGIAGLRGAVAFVGAHRRHDAVPVRRAVAIVLVVLLAALTTLLWPYLSFLSNNVVAAKENAPYRDTPFSPYATLYVLAAVAMVRAIWNREKRVGWLVLAFGATALVYVLMRVVDLDYRARYVFFMAFFPQVIVAAQLARDLVDWKKPVSLLFIAGVIASVWHSPFVQKPNKNVRALSTTALVRAAPARDAFLRRWQPIADRVGPDDVVLQKDTRDALVLAGVTGARGVAVKYASHIEDMEKREADVAAFFLDGTSDAERARIVTAYGVTKVLRIDSDGALQLTDARGDTGNGLSGGNVLGDDSAGADESAVADVDTAKDDGP